ncbi:MAG: ABC transporter permease [Nitrospira sp.]
MLGFEARDLSLIFGFARNHLREKHIGSILGSSWSVLQPLLMLAVYTFVFGFVFKVKFPGAETTFGYTVWLLSGFGPWMGFTEAVMASAVSITSATGLIKNVAFKTEVLPIAAGLTGTLPIVVSLCFLGVLLVIDGNTPSWHVLLLPLVVVSQFLLVASVGIPLSAITVFFRDLTYALPNLLMIVLFMSPIFYPVESMPHVFQTVSAFNPIYILVEAYRSILLYHQPPNLLGLGYVSILGIVLTALMLRMFRRVKGYFESVL